MMHATVHDAALYAVKQDRTRARPENARVRYLDGWRGLALIGVLIDHYIGKHGVNTGRLGVEMFFILSGRLMAEILFVRDTTLRNFIARRVSRIYPALFVFVIGMALVTWATGWNVPSFGQFLSAITFTANYARLWIGEDRVMDHIWSLCVEEHSYILLGVVALAWRRWRFPLVPALIALALAFMLNGAIETALGLPYETVYWRSDTRAASILAGGIAFLLLRREAPPLLAGSWMPLILGVAGVVLSFKAVPDPIKHSLGTVCLAMSLVLMARAPSFARAILEHPLLVQTGLWSYSIYLWQQPFFRLGVAMHVPRLALLPLAVVIGVISFHVVEQPARRWLNGRWHAHRDIVRG